MQRLLPDSEQCCAYDEAAVASATRAAAVNAAENRGPVPPRFRVASKDRGVAERRSVAGTLDGRGMPESECLSRNRQSE